MTAEEYIDKTRDAVYFISHQFPITSLCAQAVQDTDTLIGMLELIKGKCESYIQELKEMEKFKKEEVELAQKLAHSNPNIMEGTRVRCDVLAWAYNNAYTINDKKIVDLDRLEEFLRGELPW